METVGLFLCLLRMRGEFKEAAGPLILCLLRMRIEFRETAGRLTFVFSEFGEISEKQQDYTWPLAHWLVGFFFFLQGRGCWPGSVRHHHGADSRVGTTGEHCDGILSSLLSSRPILSSLLWAFPFVSGELSSEGREGWWRGTNGKKE